MEEKLSSRFNMYNDPTHSHKSQPHLSLGPSSTNEPLPSLCTSRNHFHTLETDSEVDEAKKKVVPKNTDKNASWAVNIWSAHCCKVCTGDQEGQWWPVSTWHSVQLLQWIAEVHPRDKVTDECFQRSYYYLQDSREPWTAKWNGYMHLVLQLRSRQKPIIIEEEKTCYGRRASSWETQTLNNS